MILPSPTAPAGSVRSMFTWTPKDIPSGSAVLCRNNAPLIACAFALLSVNHSCYILGKDIAAQLTTQLKKFTSATDLPSLRSAIRQWRDTEVEKFERANRMAKAANVRDRAECLLLFVNKARSGPTEVPLLIEQLFSPKSGGTVLSTVHKAKGLEWETVFILDLFLIGKFAKGDWQKEQERNLHYVAATRAKLNLLYIESENLVLK